MLVNVPLLCLVFMWTTVAQGLDAELNEQQLGIQARRGKKDKKCRKLDGFCVHKRKDCPKFLPETTSLGKPFCGKKKSRCCYPAIATAPPTLAPTTVTPSPVVFVIKHKLSGKYVHPYASGGEIPEGNRLVVHSDLHSKMHMTFDLVDKEFGYIRHIKSGKLFAPHVSTLNPDNNVAVELHGALRPWALFAIDQVNHVIVHKGGKYIHPLGGSAYPPDDTNIVLHEHKHNRMEFQLVNPFETTEVVYPYGKVKVSGEWRLVFSVKKPLAAHTQTITVKQGYSKTHSIEGTVKFGWEFSTNAEVGIAKIFFSASVSVSHTLSLSAEIKQSSSSTWTSEINTTYRVEVNKGETVAVWQRVFIGEQLGHRALYQSNMYADTRSPSIKPDDEVNPKIHFN